jgi:hypothetical protein
MTPSEMPSRSSSQTTVTEMRLNNLKTCLTIAANSLEILADNFKTPFLGAISNTTQSLLKYVEVYLFDMDLWLQ